MEEIVKTNIIIQTGSIYELYEYEHSICGVGGHKEKKDLANKEKNYQFQVMQRRSMVRRLVCANFDNDNAKFLTLTFADNETDVQKCDLIFKNFIKRLKYRYKKDLKYVAVIEFQKRGAVHYHVILDLPYVPQEELEKVWGQRFCIYKQNRPRRQFGCISCQVYDKGNGRCKIARKSRIFTFT